MAADLRTLFEEKLSEILFIERELSEMLPKLGRNSVDPDVKEAFINHGKETEWQLRRVKEAIDLIGLKKKEKESRVFVNMEKDRELFVKKSPGQAALDFFNLDNAVKTERLESSYYEAIITLAKVFNLPNKKDFLNLLRQNLKEEARTLLKTRELLRGFVKGSLA